MLFENEIKRIKKLFFVNKHIKKILCKNFEIFVMNCTYKINKYDMSMFVVMNHISLNTNFYIDFAFIEKKKRKISFESLSKSNSYTNHSIWRISLLLLLTEISFWWTFSKFNILTFSIFYTFDISTKTCSKIANRFFARKKIEKSFWFIDIESFTFTSKSNTMRHTRNSFVNFETSTSKTYNMWKTFEWHHDAVDFANTKSTKYFISTFSSFREWKAIIAYWSTCWNFLRVISWSL